MKKLSLIFLLSISIMWNASAQTWPWVKQIGGTQREGSGAAFVDNNGNMYLQGVYWSDICYFQSDTLILLPAIPNGDFIAKYDPNGNEQWIFGYDGTIRNNVYFAIGDAAFDKNNNCFYITGSTFGNGNIGGYAINSGSDPRGILIAKFDLNGNCLWARRVGTSCTFPGCSSCTADGWRIAVDDYGDVIIAGQNYCNTLFDTITVQAGFFLAKYNGNGNCIWAKKKFDINSSSEGFDAIIYSLKAKGRDIFVMGQSTKGSFTVDGITLNPNYTNGQHLVARFDSLGLVKWIKPCGGVANGGASNVEVDDNYNCYIAGAFNQVAYFGNQTLNTNNTWDFFFAKYDPNGQPIWIKQGNASVSSGIGPIFFNDNNIYILGSFRGSITLGANTLNSTGLYGDSFIAKYTLGGNLDGVKQNSFPGGNSINVDGNGSVYITGTFGFPQDSVIFGANPPLITRGEQDIFIAKSDVITSVDQGGSSRLSNMYLLIYANPNKGSCTVDIPIDFKNENNLSLRITDNRGRLVQVIPVQMQEGKISLSIEAEAKGIYNATLSNGKKMYYGKIVFE